MFRGRPHNPDGWDKLTPAQRAASQRNFRIFQLRGLHAQVRLLTGKRRDRAMALVDQELVAMGALPMAEHAAERARKLNEKLVKAATQEPRKCIDCGEIWNECDCIPF